MQNLKTRMMIAAACCAVLATAAAQAQDAARGEKAAAKLEERFDGADSNHDGKLSPDEAKAGMPRVSKHFAEMDANSDGYVSKPEITAAMIAMKEKRDAGTE